MNKKFLALALSGALTLSLLAACGSPDAEGTTPPVSTPPATESLVPTPTPTPEVTPSETPEPTESIQPTETPEPSESVQPSESQKPAESPKPSESQKPAESPKPSESQKPAESPAPSESTQPSETPAPSASVVQSIWNEVSGLERPDMMDLDATLLSDLYGIDPADLVEFVAKMPLMSANVTEFLIAQCAPGRVDAVKAACEARVETLKGGGMYPETIELLDNYKIVTSGDYILFCVDEHADAMVEAFNTYAK